MASNARPVTVNSYGQKFVEKVTSELLKKNHQGITNEIEGTGE